MQPDSPSISYRKVTIRALSRLPIVAIKDATTTVAAVFERGVTDPPPLLSLSHRPFPPYSESARHSKREALNRGDATLGIGSCHGIDRGIETVTLVNSKPLRSYSAARWPA